MRTPERLVLDSHAILTYLNGEPEAERVHEILTHGEPWMTLITLGEVAYIVERGRGRVAADAVFVSLLANELPDRRIQIRWLPIDEPLVRRAASLKAAGGMSYADCFVAAAAGIIDCPVLTGDPEFEVAEKAGIAVTWL